MHPFGGEREHRDGRLRERHGSATAPADYLATNGTLTFGPGEASKQIVVQVVGDNAVEANETFSVNLANPTNASIARSGFGLGTITNND